MKPKFEPTEDGLEIIDPIERHRYQLTTHEPVSPQMVDTDRIQYPVDAAVEISAAMITLPENTTIYVRDQDGEMIAEASPSRPISLPEGIYTLDISFPLKLYIRLQSSISIYSDRDNTYINIGGRVGLTIGARSYHTRPAGTITTTQDPTDVMQAVSAFGSALKTVTVERSYPTLRGHPPAIELGNELEIPSKFKTEETGIQIKIPPSLRHVFVISPLAYYLGAEVVSGSKPQIITDKGYSYALDKEYGLETTVERLLKHIFFLDCIVRTEGLTPLPLHERQAVESVIEFDIEAVYDQSLADQLEIYLNVPFSVIEPYLPEWRLKTQLKPTKESIEFLSFIVNYLTPISIQKRQENPAKQVQTNAIEEFSRGDFNRSTNSSRGSERRKRKVNYSEIPTIQQSWEDNSSTKIVSTTPVSAFYNSIGRSPKDSPIEIEVVCNDRDMHEEVETVNNVYGIHKNLPFDVTLHHHLTIEELRSVLTGESDFFHYIGHIDDEGFQCSDGKLDVSGVNDVGVKAFLLNACQSYDQGLHLVDAGSTGGIVTFNEVVNSGAVRVGSTIASLLNQGFPLYAALNLARKESIVGEQYRVVGDGITTISQSKNGAPSVCLVDQNSEGNIVTIVMYVSTGSRKGSLFTPYIEPVDSYYLIPGKTERIPVTESQLEEFFNLEELPVIIDGAVRWSNNVSIEDL